MTITQKLMSVFFLFASICVPTFSQEASRFDPGFAKGIWVGAFFGQNTGTHMTDDTFDITETTDGKLEVEYSGLGRFQQDDGRKFAFPRTEVIIVTDEIRFNAGRFQVHCKVLAKDTLQCTKTLPDGRGNQGKFTRKLI